MAKQYKLTCKHCGREFYHTNNMKEYCSDECKQAHKEIGICLVCGKEFPKNHPRQNTCSKECHRILHARQNSENAQNKLKAKEGIEGYDFVTCKECGAHLTNFNEKHFAMHGLTRETYEAKYGKITQWTAQKLIDEKLIGENNPNSVAKTDEQTRKERSPFSPEFYKARNIDDQEREKFIKGIDRVQTTQLEYYTRQGYSIEKARELLSERQRTVTLERFIEVYGEDEGYERYKQRGQRWKNSLINRKDSVDVIGRIVPGRYSNVSQELFNSIHEKLVEQNIIGLTEKYATNNGEFVILNEEESAWYSFDYTIPELDYIIEFNGELFHPRLEKLTEKEFKEWECPLSDKSGYEILLHDNKKADFIRNRGYRLKIVWESDYRKDKDAIVSDCVNEIISLYKQKFPSQPPTT